jgi:hypothetical protein
MVSATAGVLRAEAQFYLTSVKFYRLYWQDTIHLMNANNPSGNVLRSSQYASCLVVAMIVSFFVAIKRFWLGLTLGRKAYSKFFHTAFFSANFLLTLFALQYDTVMT